MKAIQRALAALLLAACVLLGCGGGGSTPAPSAPPSCTVELNGDSAMFGPWLAAPPPKALQNVMPSWQVDDRAVGGLTLRALWEGYDSPYPDAEDFPQFWPRGPQPPFAQAPRTSSVIVIEIGGNDARELNSPELFERRLRATIATVRAEGRIPVLTGVIPVNVGDYFTEETAAMSVVLNEVTLKVAADMGVVNARWDTVEFHGIHETFDTVHRKQEASDRLVLRLAETLRQVLPHCR